MDLASGHVAALKKLKTTENLRFKVYNLGLGRGISVVELVGEFEKATGTKVPTVQGGRRFGDVGTLICGAERALSELDWKPKYQLPQMCEDFWRWQTMNPDGYKGELHTNGNGVIEQNGKGALKNGATHVNGDGVKATNGH